MAGPRPASPPRSDRRDAVGSTTCSAYQLISQPVSGQPDDEHLGSIAGTLALALVQDLGEEGALAALEHWDRIRSLMPFAIGLTAEVRSALDTAAGSAEFREGVRAELQRTLAEAMR